ncbi:MAG: hypothetical protein A2Z93_09680 [Curvibacter sp. GWA2_64_110]|nr:MAG: hypothetical protein A2Z93_09680 [Curvibacter sp. GWA2_64_110]
MTRRPAASSGDATRCACKAGADQGLFTLISQDALRIKKVMRKARNAAGVAPGKASQRRAWPFWPQPEGNGEKTAPLVVAFLAQAASLGVVARLDWRGFLLVRTCEMNVNRP